MSKTKEWLFIDPLGNKYTTTNMAKFCRDMALSEHGASKCARGIRRQFNDGWKCFKKNKVYLPEDNKPVEEEPIKGSVIRTVIEKGNVWYCSDDILSILGYSENSYKIRNNDEISPYIKKLSIRYWNSTSLYRLREHLKKTNANRFAHNWDALMLAVNEAKNTIVFRPTDEACLSNPIVKELNHKIEDLETKVLELAVESKSKDCLVTNLQQQLDTTLIVSYSTVEKKLFGNNKHEDFIYTTLRNLHIDIMNLVYKHPEIKIHNINKQSLSNTQFQ